MNKNNKLSFESQIVWIWQIKYENRDECESGNPIKLLYFIKE